MLRNTLLAIAGLAAASPAFGQEVSQRARTAAFIEVVATRGVECEIVKPWQAAALRAANQQDMAGFSDERIQETIGETKVQLEKTTCTNDAMNIWVEGSRPGFESEMLPPYLIAYRQMARLETPPKAFTGTALRLDYAPVIAAIDAKLDAIASSGATAEGGRPWPEYISRTETQIAEFVTILTDPEASGPAADEAASWLAQSARIVELWFKDQD